MKTPRFIQILLVAVVAGGMTHLVIRRLPQDRVVAPPGGMAELSLESEAQIHANAAFDQLFSAFKPYASSAPHSFWHSFRQSRSSNVVAAIIETMEPIKATAQSESPPSEDDAFAAGHDLGVVVGKQLAADLLAALLDIGYMSSNDLCRMQADIAKRMGIREDPTKP